MLIGLTLTVLLVLTLFSILTGNSFITGGIFGDIDASAIINGTTTEFIVSGDSIALTIDPTMGLVVSLVIIFGGIALLSINVIGTGLGDEGVRLISVGIMYTVLWSFLSVLALPLFGMIDVYGSLAYISLTILYVIGVIQKTMGGSDTE